MKMQSVATRSRGLFVIMSFLSVPAYAGAQTAPAGLPDAKTLIAQYQKALGGAEVYGKVQSIHMTGTFEMPAMGMTGTVETFTARPNKNYVRVNIGGFGDVLNGTDGTVAWSVNPMAGATVLKGDELAAALEDADFNDNLRDPAKFKSVETVDKTTMDGRVCYKVKLTRNSGRVTYDCYGVDDHLLVATIDTRTSDGQTLETQTFAREYKEFGGIKMPTKLVVHVADQDQVITLNAVQVNTVTPDKFELPAEIKALVKK